MADSLWLLADGFPPKLNAKWRDVERTEIPPLFIYLTSGSLHS